MGLRSIRDWERVLRVFVHSELSVGCSKFAARIKTGFLDFFENNLLYIMLDKQGNEAPLHAALIE